MPDRREELWRIGDTMRLIIERLVGTSATGDLLTNLADALEAVAAGLESVPQGHVFEGFPEAANAGTVSAFFDHSPFIGLANPLAPPLQLEVIDDVVHGKVRMGSAYEGPPGCVHGGFVAGIFDELLGLTQSLSGQPGMTGTLTVRYRRPTPLHTDLRMEGRLLRVEGRKIFTEGQLFGPDGLTAEAEGLFISVDMSKFADLLAQAEARDKNR